MNSFFKKASIVLLVVVLVPSLAFAAYAWWLVRQDDEVSVLNLQCESYSDSDEAYYFYRISKIRSSDTPDYFSYMNTQYSDSFQGDDLFVKAFELLHLTNTHAEYTPRDGFQYHADDKPVDVLLKINRESLLIEAYKDEELDWSRKCEEISEREIMKVARKNLAAATKDRKF